MKRSLLALSLSVTFAASAHAQSSVTLYGLIDTGIVYTNNQSGHSNWQMVTSSTQNTVFGLKGSEDLGGGLHTVFKLEQGFNLNNGTQAFAGDGFGSQAWIGLQSDPYGTVTLTLPANFVSANRAFIMPLPFAVRRASLVQIASD